MKRVQILGTGCPKCRKLAERVKSAAEELDLPCEVEKVTDIQQITQFGVMLTPALAVEGEVKVAGEVPTVAELKDLLQ